MAEREEGSEEDDDVRDTIHETNTITKHTPSKPNAINKKTNALPFLILSRILIPPPSPPVLLTSPNENAKS